MRRNIGYYRMQILHMAENLPAGYVCRRSNPYRIAVPPEAVRIVRSRASDYQHPVIYRIRELL